MGGESEAILLLLTHALSVNLHNKGDKFSVVGNLLCHIMEIIEVEPSRRIRLEISLGV